MPASSPATYYDPLPDLLQSVGRPIPMTEHSFPGAEDFLRGVWEERNWRNVPGPIYGAETDSCWVARTFAPGNAVYEHETGQEFLYRQPRDEDELLAVLAGAWADPFGGWAADGDSHWTVQAVRDWWQDRDRVSEWIKRDLRAITADDRREVPAIVEVMDDFAAGLRAYQSYLDGPLEADLRVYMFWLDQGCAPKVGDGLPELP